MAFHRCTCATNFSEVRSFLGMLQYCGGFIPNLAEISAPLCLLTHKDVKWVWTLRQQHAFETLKELLTADTIMSYFDPAKHTQLHVDASPFGLGAILTIPGHDDAKVIAYASRSLTATESQKLSVTSLLLPLALNTFTSICMGTSSRSSPIINL